MSTRTSIWTPKTWKLSPVERGKLGIRGPPVRAAFFLILADVAGLAVKAPSMSQENLSMKKSAVHGPTWATLLFLLDCASVVDGRCLGPERIRSSASHPNGIALFDPSLGNRPGDSGRRRNRQSLVILLLQRRSTCGKVLMTIRRCRVSCAASLNTRESFFRSGSPTRQRHIFSL